jgi:amidase
MRRFACCLLVLVLLPLGAAADLTTRSALELRDALAAGELTATEVTAAFLARIDAIDASGPTLNAVLTVNPDAQAIAAELDRQFQDQGPRGPLHGVPVLLKDNIDTGDAMPTTAGSLALADHRAVADASLVTRLREAGAVILGKTNLSEWANFRDNNSSSGWSSLGGQTRNPYVLDRNPCGSSSGSGAAVAARLAPFAVGTETDGSIACPAGINGVVGIKPTVGMVSRRGIIPIAATQDTAGPMARSVADAALLLAVLAGPDPADPASKALPAVGPITVPAPGTGRLDGVRIGVFRGYEGAGTLPRVDALFEAALATLSGLGAELVDELEWRPAPSVLEAEYQVLLHEFKAGLNAYLAASRVPADRNSLARLIAWNDAHAHRVMPIFGQDIFIAAEATGGLEAAHYRAALAAGPERMRRELGALLTGHRLDALVSATNGPAWKTDWVRGDRFEVWSSSLAAMSGFPSVIVPAGVVAGLPIAVSFIGPPLSEQRLIGIGHEFEQALQLGLEPGFVATLESRDPAPSARLPGPVQ